MPLDMPESVLVKFTGELQPGVTLRDIVNAIPWVAMQEGKLTAGKGDKINVFNGRIMEMEGLPDLKVEQAFELTDATAERSCSGSTIKLSEETVAEYLRSNVSLLKKYDCPWLSRSTYYVTPYCQDGGMVGKSFFDVGRS